MIKAVAYYRTSSATSLIDGNVESEVRQREAVIEYANRSGHAIEAEFYDAVVKGTDSVDVRKQFINLMKFIESNAIKTILIETASRFSRDLIVQLTGHQMLKKKGVSIIPVDAPEYFSDATPTMKFIRQVLGAVTELERTMLVDKMKVARDRIRAETGRCEGRKPPLPEAIDMARKLRSEGKSLVYIGNALSGAGYRVRKKIKDGPIITTNKIYAPQSVKKMLEKSYG